jgi:hypothetical protein
MGHQSYSTHCHRWHRHSLESLSGGLLNRQLENLNKAYARWTDADPNTSGTVSLKLRIEPSGKVTKIEEVVSTLSEHRFLDVIIAEAKLWKLPHGGTTSAEVSVPLIFNPHAPEPAQQVVERQASRARAALAEIADSAYELRPRRSRTVPAAVLSVIAKKRLRN